ncbi:MAG: hypothetical protein ACREYF_09645 [Gammaproteobacteria bacterium]
MPGREQGLDLEVPVGPPVDVEPEHQPLHKIAITRSNRAHAGGCADSETGIDCSLFKIAIATGFSALMR